MRQKSTGFETPVDAGIIARRLVSYVQPDVIQCGGITKLKTIAAMAETQFIEVAPHCPGSLSTGLGLASLHIDSSISNCVIQESLPNPAGQQVTAPGAESPRTLRGRICGGLLMPP
jgi:L-alanine-DL-glutamate epimerase-like enolase superfamily enzyme